MRWSGASARTHVRQGSLEADLLLEPGQRHDLVLELSTSALSRPPVDPRRAWNDTEATWLGDEPRLADSLCPGDVRHSHAVLRGLTSRAGGMVAAGTMSLPERAERGSYDYRYAWIRDQCYAGRAAAVAGAWPLLDSAADFVADRLLADGPDLRPAYTVSGGAIPGERELHLPGYPGGTDKVGNRVNEQFQLDTLGEALLLFTAVRDVDRLGPQHVKAAHTAIDAIDRRWQQPDAGIWELDDRRWAHSRLMCAAGLRRWGTSKDGTPTGGTASRLEEFADVLVDDVDRDSLHVTGRWQRSPDDDRVDAALLLPGLRGAVAHDDPRHIATWQAVLGELADDYYLYRFSQGDGPLADFEGAFVLCGFQMALVSHQQGDRVEAARWFERNRGAVGPPGLYAEEFDVVQRQLRGNLPQAFVHALLIESAVTLHQHPTTSPSGRETP
jgi:GH15 family glucan-1,4-alpha-glucosidase